MHRRALTLAVAPALALAVAGCSSSSTGPATAIAVTQTDTECTLSALTAPVGAVEFTITNKGTKVNELYVTKGGDEIGEVENIAVGLTRTLRVDITEPGDYAAVCKPGMSGDGIKTPFTVTTGTSTAAAS